MPTLVISLHVCAQIKEVLGYKLTALVIVATADDGGMAAKNGGIGQF